MMLNRGTLNGDEFTIDFADGAIKFRNEEGTLYSRIFHIIDTDMDGLIGGSEGAFFIRRANLSNEDNREIWRLASGGKSLEKLNKDCWFVAMKLVAMVQHTGRCDIQSLYKGDTYPLAEFQLEGPPDSILPGDKNGTIVDAESFRVTVSTPVVAGSGYSRYTQYIISTKADSSFFPVSFAQVKRRYSDFEWLQQRLLIRFRGTIIPPLPEKKWAGSMDATFVEERRQALEYFINEICHHGKLSKTLELQIVLTASVEGLAAGKELLKVHSLMKSMLPNPASIVSMWSTLKDGAAFSSSVQQVEIPADDEYAKIGEYIEIYEKRISQVKMCSDNIYTAQRAEGYEMSRFGSYLSALSAFLKNDQSMQALFQAGGDLFENVSNLYQDQLDKILAMYVSVVRYQMGKISAVKVVMSNRETAIMEVQKANISMQRNKERFAAARASSGAAASAMRAEQKMTSAEDRLNHAKEQVHFIATSLKHESKKLDNGKAMDLKRALLSLAHLEKDYHAQAQSAWASLIPLIDVSSEIHAQSQKRVSSHVSYRKPGEKSPSELIGLL